MKTKTKRQLDRAKKTKFNEYYTPRETIEDLVAKVGTNLQGRSVWCLSDGRESEFTKVFAQEFTNLGLKKLVCTSFNKDRHGLALIKESNNTDFTEIQLEGDGDYTSSEVIELSKDCDTVITNPPFTGIVNLWQHLASRKLQYIIICPFYALVEIARFQAIYGYIDLPKIYQLKTAEFFVPNPQDYKQIKPYSLDQGRGLTVAIHQAVWVSTFGLGQLPTLKLNDTPFLELQKQGKIDTYKLYSGQIIEIPRVSYIPKDLPNDVILSVPVSILGFDLKKSGFELAGVLTNVKWNAIILGQLVLGKDYSQLISGKWPFARILIQKVGSNAAQKFAERNNIPSYKSQEIEQYYAKYRINKGHNNEN